MIFKYSIADANYAKRDGSADKAGVDESKIESFTLFIAQLPFG